MESQAVAETEGWLSYEVPGPAVSLAETRQYLVLCDNRDNVFYSSLESSSLTWRRTSYPASEVRSFRCGGDSLVAAQSHRLLQPQQDKPAGQGWLEICRNVASLPELLVLATRRSFHCLTSLMKWPV